MTSKFAAIGLLALAVTAATDASAQRGQPGMQPGGMGGHAEYGAIDHAYSGRQREKMNARRMMRHQQRAPAERRLHRR